MGMRCVAAMAARKPHVHLLVGCGLFILSVSRLMLRVICLVAFLWLDLLFFFSSRRRHTRWPRDWSSDVCSSDLTGGILIGLLSAIAYHKFKHIEFPEYIQFFGGPRFVPLFMSVATTGLAGLFIWLGPYLVDGLGWISNGLLVLGGFGAFVYGILHRLLVATGLHHILNNVFWFQIGSYDHEAGRVFGDLPRFFAGDPEAGIYMAGLYPIMMFAIPAIAFAIKDEAREDLMPKVKATFLVAALTCFLTGVSEPIEFAFLFVAPYLFVLHAIISGVSMWLVYELGIRDRKRVVYG